jgi:hypothetical protein
VWDSWINRPTVTSATICVISNNENKIACSQQHIAIAFEMINSGFSNTVIVIYSFPPPHICFLAAPIMHATESVSMMLIFSAEQIVCVEGINLSGCIIPLFVKQITQISRSGIKSLNTEKFQSQSLDTTPSNFYPLLILL